MLFADCKAAFYRAVADEALGPITTEHQRAEICEELGVSIEDMMALEDQHGGYSHPTSHSTSSDLTTSLHTSCTDSMAILTCVAAREQVLLSTSLSTTLHFPPRSGCLAVVVDRAVLWPQVADDPGYRLERPALGMCWTGT